MSVKITYFVHGTTTDNERGLATGCLPGELSELGVKQAKELGGFISNRYFDAVFCSDLKRAVDSAQFTFGSKYRIVLDKRLRECDYGELTGQPFVFDLKKYINNPFPNGESYRDVERRIADFLNFLKKDYNNKQVAIVAHQAPQLALDVLLKGKTWEQAIEEDWRKKGKWQPGWEYIVK